MKCLQLTILCFCWNSAISSHLINLHLEYEWLGGGKFLITAKRYRFCDTPLNQPSVQFSSSLCFAFPFSLQLIAKNSVEFGCPLVASTINCASGSSLSFEEAIYQDTLALTAAQLACSDWKLFASSCCRYSMIDNLPSSGGLNYYLDLPLVYSNNSPKYTSIPILLIAAGEEFHYNPGAYDPDGDSLAYQLVPTQTLGGMPVSYIFPYSLTSPFGISSPFAFDATTGSISGVPASPCHAMIQIQVLEYRCGTLIGYSNHEIFVKAISNTGTVEIPFVKGGGYDTIYNGIAIDTNSFFVIPGDTISFSIFASDQNPGDTLHFLVQAVTFPSGATLTQSGINPATGLFFWNTSPADSGYYGFTITVTDSSCQYMNKNIYFFEIWVGSPGFPAPAVPGLSATFVPPSGFNFSSASIDLTVNGTGPFFYFWTNGMVVEDPNGIPGGTYSVTVFNNSCSASLTINIPACTADATITPDSLVCGTVAILQALPGMSTYTWCSGQTTSAIVATSSGSYCVLVSDTLGCLNADTVNLTFYPTAFVTLGPDTVLCFQNSFLLSPGSSFQSYLWSPGMSTNSSLLVTSGWTYSVAIVDTNGCPASDSITVQFSNPTVNLGADQYICPGSTVTLFGQAGFASWSWSNGTTNQNTMVGPGNYVLIATDSGGCAASDTVNIFFKNISVSLGADTSICPGGSVILDPGAGYVFYNWCGGQTSQTIAVNLPGSYCIQVTDSGGCFLKDTMNVFFQNLNVNLGSDTIICPGDSLTLDPGTGFQSYQWCGGQTAQTKVVKTAGTYCVNVTNFSGCLGSDTINVGVAQPGVAFTSSGAGLSIVFTAISNSAQSWNWDFGDGSSPSGLSSPLHNYANAGTFTVCLTITDTNGCQADTCEDITVPFLNRQEEGDYFVIISPNPATNHINIDWVGELPEMSEIRISDLTGRLIRIEKPCNCRHQEIVLEGFVPGVYLLGLGTPEHRKYFKFNLF